MSVRSGLAAAAAVVLLGAGAPALAGDEPKKAERGGEAPADRVKRVSRALEEIRGKKFKTEVGIETQDAEDFRKFVDGEIDKELPPAKALAVSKALQAFGLLPPGYDLRKGLSDLYVSQAGAYYNPATKKFYMLMVSMPEDQLDTIVLHELMHALQDQYHDLATLTKRVQAANDDDATAAFQSVVEGEATFVMMEDQLKRMLGMSPDALPPEAQEQMFGRMRDADRAFLLDQAEAQGKTLGKGGDEIKKALAALKTMPGYLFWSLHAPYFRGQYAVYVAHKGGWDAVEALFEQPPASTEQVFHPEKLAGPKKDEPTRVALATDAVGGALGPEWTFLHGNVLGELGVYSLMDERLTKGGPERRGAVAAGWDGDRYAAFECKTGAVALVWKTVWDTETDAREFHDALAEIGFDDLAAVPGDPRAVVALRNVPRARRDAVLEALRK